MKPLASNTLLQNRYLIVHLIGRGGMGEVYLAIDQRLGNPVALKRTAFFDDELLGNAFEREAKTLARLRHNALPKVIDHFLEDGNQYLVMEYIAGDDLSKRLEISNKPFPVDWVMFWADRLLDALDYLHSNEPPIVHRDIKPQNLKLTEDNQIVLLDFGLAKNSVDASAGAATTGSSVVGYTPQYAPLEQIRGTGTNARSDIFSLSSTLYQLLTGTIPPDALGRADVLLGGKPDPLVPADELNPLVSTLISAIILKGMEVSQDKRYAAASEMQRELRAAYAQQNGFEMPPKTAASGSPIPQTSNQQALKTNVVSNAEPRNSPPSLPRDANVSLDSPTNRDEFVSRSPLSKPLTGSLAAPPAHFQTNSNAFATSVPSGQNSRDFAQRTTTETASQSEPEKQTIKKSSSAFAAIGALVLMCAAGAAGIYIFNRSKTETAAPATKVETATPTIQPDAIVKPDEIAPVAKSETVAEVAGTPDEKQERKTAADSGVAKTVQPPNQRINQKPAAQSPEIKNSKIVAKPTQKTERLPTPLPRILP